MKKLAFISFAVLCFCGIIEDTKGMNSFPFRNWENFPEKSDRTRCGKSLEQEEVLDRQPKVIKDLIEKIQNETKELLALRERENAQDYAQSLSQNTSENSVTGAKFEKEVKKLQKEASTSDENKINLPEESEKEPKSV